MKHSRNHIIFRFIPFFFRFVQIDLRSGVLHAFFSRRQEKKVPFHNQSFFVISPVRSNPFPQFFTGSFAVDFGDHLRSRIICGPFWGSFAVGDHLRYCTVLKCLWSFRVCIAHSTLESALRPFYTSVEVSHGVINHVNLFMGAFQWYHFFCSILQNKKIWGVLLLLSFLGIKRLMLFACIFLFRNTSYEESYKESGYYYLNNFDDLLHSYGKTLHSAR